MTQLHEIAYGSDKPRFPTLAGFVAMVDQWSLFLSAAIGIACGICMTAMSQVWPMPVPRAIFGALAVQLFVLAWNWAAIAVIFRLFPKGYLRSDTSKKMALFAFEVAAYPTAAASA